MSTETAIALKPRKKKETCPAPPLRGADQAVASPFTPPPLTRPPSLRAENVSRRAGRTRPFQPGPVSAHRSCRGDLRRDRLGAVGLVGDLIERDGVGCVGTIRGLDRRSSRPPQRLDRLGRRGGGRLARDGWDIGSSGCARGAARSLVRRASPVRVGVGGCAVHARTPGRRAERERVRGATSSAAYLLGPLVGGAVLGLGASPATLFTVDAGTFVVSALLLATIGRRSVAARRRSIPACSPACG
jgi:hypothetical protein